MGKIKTSNTNIKHKSKLLGYSTGVLMTLFAPSILAAEIQAAIDSKNKESKDLEVIEVTGIRDSLENALNTKREADSIVDAISAEDIDGLPALDLGEALQAIPGIQLNTDDGSRNSEINLRGLPGGYAKVTAEGQSFATPSRSQGIVGNSNPFGAFEAGVFDGVTVIKAPTADMQEGGIGGIVDKKLQRALGKKDGQYSFSVGSRYEELADNWDKTIKFSASKHLIKDKLAVAFKVSASEQNFRRDTANFTQYTSLNTVDNNSIKDTTFISADDLNAYKSQHGITDPLAIVKVIGKAGQVTENSRGDRISATGNIEFKPTDAFKIGANFLFTKRDLGESNMEDVQFYIDSNDNNGNQNTQRVIPIGAPIQLSNNANPDYVEGLHHPDLATIPVYAVTHAEMTNVSWTPSNRLSSSKEEAKGIFLYADYLTDNWHIDGTISVSEAESEGILTGLDLRHTNKRNNQYYTDLDSGERLNFSPTGINGVINTGNGNLNNAFASISGYDDYLYSDVNGIFSQVDPETGELIYDLGDNAWKRFGNGWESVPLTSFGSRLDPKINQGDLNDFPAGYFPAAPIALTPEQEAALTPEQIEERAAQSQARADAIAKFGGKSLDYYVNGRVTRPIREFESGELNFERYLEIGTSAFSFTSLKFGARHSRETLQVEDLRVGGGGMNLSQIGRDVLYKEKLSSDEQTVYFNGDYAGHYGSDAGWSVLDSQHLATIVQQDMTPYDPQTGEVVENYDIADPTGFPVKLENATTSPAYGLNQFYRNNFYADQAINAVYLMGKFEGEIGNILYTGNAGIRYVETTNDVIGQGFDDEGKGIAVLVETDYANTLPSFNAAFELSEDIVLRTAYSKALVRPNLLSQTPSPINDNGRSTVKLENAKAEVLPYTAQNYDLSLAWYNREGSAISIGMFVKDIEGKIQTQTICPVGEHEKWDVGELEHIDDGSSSGLCQEIGEFETDDGEILTNRKVTIKETFNSDIPITVTGYELAIQQKLDFLPYPWNGFGGVFNFTKIDLDEGEGAPMTRIAPHSANLIGYYENDGFSLRLAYNWQDEKLLSTDGVTNFLGSDARTQTSGGRLDLSASYKFAKGFNFNLRAFNLNNRQEYEYIGGNEDAISRIRYAGRIYTASLSYSF
ncbi:TonB-dependent receptor [Psychrosphaera sp. 1_MG-2023]|uniref:TonB-dependent receptor domain-containing protein n=1 Tax=Psychrosphaera sp. 1_MG-2023 TaxID=3062643 RepID=UPI0026E28E31|nr:TonB-dependent receptor [Psychrosphaera sp. 1_MG-2023]MDO6719837.1 TonB-dependent receptor [Psychrosphaera sp. 1_MG-2023]